VRCLSFICKVKVLILHQHFNTPQKGGPLRSYYLARALADVGIQATVITSHGLATEKIEIVDGITVHYLPNPYDNRFGFYKRGLSFVKYIFQSVRAARRYRDADICYAISTPLTIGLAARWIQLRYGIPYIFEVGDLWPDAPVQLGVIKSPLFKSALYRLEKTIYHRAKALVALSPSIADAISRRAPGKTIHTIPNMADTAFFRKEEEKSRALEEKYSVSDKLVVSYIGALGVANGLDYFLECVRASEKASLPVHFILCGDGARFDYLKEAAKRLGLHSLTFTGFQDRAGVREIMNITDALFISYKPVPVLETGSPNKYFDGLAAGKLIVVNFGGWIKTEIENRRCGIFLDPKHPTVFTERIMPFLKDKALLEQYQDAARALAEEQYARTILSAKFAAIFSTI
jgi:glycosyltransferase involved in cell wall biosynthesis